MTYTTLLSAIYTNYDKLLSAWDAEMERTENIGVFAFLPEGYYPANSFGDVAYIYWTIDRVRGYLKTGGQTDDGFEDLFDDFEFGEEFLVMIIEYLGDNKKHAVHVHKITKVGLN
jgi:hypothetical protein